MKFLVKILGITLLLGIIGGIAFVAMTDAPIAQETITKTIPNDGIINNE